MTAFIPLGLMVFLIVVLHTEADNTTITKPLDRQDCIYETDTIICDRTNLTSVPNIPAGIRTLIFEYNIIPAINPDTFRNVKNPKEMVKIVFTNDRVTTITSDAFNAFSNLDYLDLSSNHICLLDLKYFLANISYSLDLRTLVLNKISENLQVEDILSGLKKSPSKSLFLQENGIQELPIKALKQLKNISKLSIDRNKLSMFKLTHIESLNFLRLNHNKLDIPNFCDPSNRSFTPNLRIMNMNYNLITELSKEKFQCLFNIEILQMKSNLISIVKTAFFANNPRIKDMDMTGSFGRHPKIEQRAFSSNTLESLRIGFVGTARSIFENISETFEGLPALKSLQIDNIDMSILSVRMIKTIFSLNKKITRLSCFKCNIRGNPTILLENKPLLTKFEMKSNSFDTLLPETFTGNPNIKVLRLNLNKIARVSQMALPINMLNKLDIFDMSFNPFNCDCNIVWFAEWLKSANKSRLRNYPNNYTCATPTKWQGKTLTEVSFSYLECHPLTTPEWIGIIGGPCIVLIAILAIILYRNRWNIKHYLYIMRKRKSYAEIEGRNYEYDVFVGYSHSDAQWVVHSLIPILEVELKLKACLHDRDFQPGAFINDNIVEFMTKSRRVILVISNDFANSNWCMFELKLAHSFLLEDGIDGIAILLENIHGKNISKPLKVLLDTTTYLEWTETDDVGRNLFVSKLKDSFE